MHLDDSGARLDALFNSRLEHGVGEEGENKDTEYAYSVPRSIVENSPTSAKLADCLRWAPRSPEVEVPSCYLQVGCLRDSGCRRRVGSNGAHDAVCWTGGRLQETARMDTVPSHPILRGLGSPGELCGREQLLAALVSSVDWVVRSTYCTAWAVTPRCRCPYAYGRRVAVGPQTGERSWELLHDLWKAIAPLMAPWCAEGEVPTCANLNYHGGSGSCVRWHRDDEGVFAGQGSPSSSFR